MDSEAGTGMSSAEMMFVILALPLLPDTCTERSTSTPESHKSNPQFPSAMKHNNDLLFVSIHGAFMTFDPLACTSRVEQDSAEGNTDSEWGGLVWNRRKRPMSDPGARARRGRRDEGWMRQDGNRRSANTGWVRGANPHCDRPMRPKPDSNAPREPQRTPDQGGTRDKKPRKVSDLAAFLSALVLFGPNMTHMTH